VKADVPYFHYQDKKIYYQDQGKDNKKVLVLLSGNTAKI